MRKKNFAFALDNLFWFIVYLLPIFAYLIHLSTVGNVSTFYDFFTSNILLVDVNNVFISSITGIFGTGGVLPLFDTSSPSAMGVVVYLSYFVLTYFVHFCVDVLMLLPRLLMNCMDKFGGVC